MKYVHKHYGHIWQVRCACCACCAVHDFAPQGFAVLHLPGHSVAMQPSIISPPRSLATFIFNIVQVRSWNGNTATDGVVEGSRG